MGATCAPGSSNVEISEADVEAERPAERFTKIINDYQADNEKLREALEEVKNQNDTIVTVNKDKTKQNEEVMKELQAMKALMETKNKALVRGRLEKALLSKATSLLADNSSMRQYLKGKLKHHFRTGITKALQKKDRWVEVYMIEGELSANDYKAGCVMLMYSDAKDVQSSNRCWILGLTVDDSKKEQIFTVHVHAEGSKKDLVFECETETQRKDWVDCINDALAEVKGTYEKMHEKFTLKLEFNKPKMGIRVEEYILESSDIDEKVIETLDTFDEDEKAEKVADKETPAEKGVSDEASGSDNEDEQKTEELPCKLIVNFVKDKDLAAAGLVENCKVIAINDTKLIGMVYSEQLRLLTTTPKPFILTFTGENYLRHKVTQKYGYTSILKELVADGENSVKNAFYDLVKGTPFEQELQSSDDQVTTIKELLSNQRRLMALLQHLQVQEVEL